MPLVAIAAVAVAGAIFYSRAQAASLAKKAKRDAEKNMGTIVTAREPAAQRSIIYGRRRTGGVYAFMHSTDAPGGLENEYMHLVIMLAGHEVNAVGDIFFDEKLVPLDASGNCVEGAYAGLVRVKKHLGTAAQEADADLIAEAGDKWTSAHRLRGIAYIYVRLKYDQNNLSAIPNISALVEGKKLYDPRTGLTAYSANPALAIRDYLTDTDYGLGVAADELNEASFIAGASLCDETVSLSEGGTEPRYTCAGVIARDTTPDKILADLSASMSAATICTGGLWHLSGGAYNAPAHSFSWDDLRGQVKIQTKDSRRDTCNAVKGTFISEKNKWQPADYPPVKNATYLAEDGERIWREMDLPFTTSAATAQRLAKIELEQARQDITLTLPLKLSGLRVQAGDVVNLNLDRYGWSAKPFEVVGWELVLEKSEGDTGGIVGIDLSLRETAPGVWDWASGEETTVDLAPNTTLPDPTRVSAPSALMVTTFAQLNADGSVSGGLQVSWIPSLDAFARAGSVQVQYKLAAAADWVTHTSLAGDAGRTIITGLASGLGYLVRIRAVRPTGAASPWVVTGAAVVAAGDNTPPGVPTSVSAIAIYTGARVTWLNPSDADLAYIEVYEATANSAPLAATNGTARVYGTDYVRQGLAIAAARWYWVRSVDASGNKSAWVSAGGIVASAIDTTGIFPINSTQIAEGEVKTPNLAANVVTAEKVGTNRIITTSANVGDAVIQRSHLVEAIIGTAQIDDLSVTKIKISTSAFTVGSVYVPNNQIATVYHGAGRRIILNYWSSDGYAMSLHSMDDNYFSLSMGGSGGTAYYAFL
jgi:hypothetical protein